MAGSEKESQNVLPRDWKSDIKRAEEIARDSDSEALKKPFLNKARFYGGDKFVLEFLGENAFYAGIYGKSHFRLVEIAVRKSEQGKGLGRKMMMRIAQRCKRKGIRKITLRTSKQETAKDFYKRFGGRITGTIEDDYEMEIRI